MGNYPQERAKGAKPSAQLSKVLVLAASAGVLVVTGLFGYVAIANSKIAKEPTQGDEFVFREPKDHPVTPEMAKAAKDLGGIQAPTFDAVDTDGKTCSLASLTEKKPLVLFFVELQCPCCKGAKPYIDRIKNFYGDVCNVVGVIDAPTDMAKMWSRAVKPQFAVIADPDMKIIRAYQAERGVYTTLVAPGGRIVKAYPGYSQEMLGDISSNIARLCGIAKRPMPVEPAPKKMTSGCIFPGTKLPGDEL